MSAVQPFPLHCSPTAGLSDPVVSSGTSREITVQTGTAVETTIAGPILSRSWFSPTAALRFKGALILTVPVLILLAWKVAVIAIILGIAWKWALVGLVIYAAIRGM